MKLLLVVFITLFSLNAQATYLRTIRIGSFPNEKTAQAALEELNQFVATHPNIVKLQEEWDFEFKQRKSGKYYITLAEPFRDRKVLQEVLDTLRLAYPDVYVTRLKSYKNRNKPIKIPQQLVHKKNSSTSLINKTQVKDENRTQLHVKSESIIQNNSSSLTKIASKNLELNSSVKKTNIVTRQSLEKTLNVAPKEEDKKDSFDYETAFYAAVGFGLLLIVLTLYYRKKSIILENKELITQEKFRQMLLEVQNKEKLISYVSHELRSPMTAIIGLTNLVLESSLSKLQKDYIEKIEKSSQYILNLINDILDLSKMQANKLTIEEVEFNINNILNYVYNIVSIQAKHNNITISINVDKDVPSHIVGDSLRVGQVLINLLSNAVKFTKNGEVTLNVRKIESFGENVTLEFNVSDTGIGMSQDQVEKLFHSYYQTDPSISREFGGTGLGLSISKHLIEMMHGEIRVQSKKGIGTTFTFHIRFGLKDSQNKRQYRLPSGKLLNKKILLVDSSNKNAIPLMQALGYFHYTTRNIPSFERIGEDFSRESYDIVIVNLNNLTDKAIKKIKEFQKNRKTKVVIFSELNISLNETLLNSFVIDGYLKPPITLQSVLDMIVDLYMNKEKKISKKSHPLKEKLRHFTGKKLLVVEDNELNHKVIAGMLANTGIELTFVKNGQHAIDLLQKGARIDLILMDINMPVKNGYETALEIRQKKRYNHIPILALSGDVSADAIRKSFKNGMQGHISKPINAEEFYSKILELFDNKSFSIATSSQEEISSFDDNEDFSVTTGLMRCHNDASMYKTILKDFIKMYSHASFDIYKLCEGGNFKKARHFVMDLKDSALNIGAYKLAETVASMEYEFEKGTRSNWREHIQEFDIVMKQLFKDIHKYLQKN